MHRSRILFGALVALLLIDLFFAAAHVIAYLSGALYRYPQWNVEREGSYPEIYQYAKWASISLSCCYLLFRRRDAVYAALAMIFVYFLLDDSIAIHETVGGWLSSLFGSERTWRLRPQDFGEIAVVAAAGSVLIAAFMFSYMRSRGPARAFARQTGVLIAMLALFGIVIDMLHSAMLVGALGETALNPALALLEDGGEMVIASIIAYWATRAAVDERWIASASPNAAPSPKASKARSGALRRIGLLAKPPGARLSL